MEDDAIDILFKLPQISTRSQAVLAKKKICEKRDLNKSAASKSNAEKAFGAVQTIEKRVTRSTAKACSTTDKIFNHLIFNSYYSDKNASSGGGRSNSSTGDSGYGCSRASCLSKDCGSVGSRDSSHNELIKSLEELCTDDTSGDANSRSAQSPLCGASPFRITTPSGVRPNMKIIPLMCGNIKALIPSCNVNSRPGPFKLFVEESQELCRSLLCHTRVHHMSPVVSLKPHGVEFFETEPAILILPLRFEPREETWLSVYYSNTSSSSPPNWVKLPRSDFVIRNRYVVIYLQHFSLFTVIEEEPYPEIMKKIRCRTGGRLRIPEVPGIEVNFQRGCLEHDIDACLRVLFDNEPLDKNDGRRLASPIISLGPHGLQFNENRLPVNISLPIPDFEEISRSCPAARLVAYQSSAESPDEPMKWQRVDVDLDIPKVVAYRHGISGVPIHTVTFPVYHFSFFKVVWDLLSSTVYEAKMGMSYFYPYISFSMMCQAFMEESNENNRFGLEVICYRSDRKLPETTNYRHRVGASLKPKLVRPGRIAVRLRSQMFEADVEAGEEEAMTKEEPDFRGRDFEKQYACKFKPESLIERGPFGKVIVERIATKTDPLFEFNLHKTGVEATEHSPSVGCERWTVFAMKELASSLQITEGNNWRKFAQYIGFTKSEIKNKLSFNSDPFLALMNMYNSRGGTPEEFINALYVVSRDIRLGLDNGSNASPGSGSSRSSRSNGSGSVGSGSQESTPIRKLLNLRPWATTRDSDSAGSSNNNNARKGDGSGSSRAKRRLHDSDSEGSSSKKRKVTDDEPVGSSESDGDDEPSVSEQHKNSQRKLRDTDLWHISSAIAQKNWRNLGRTLGIEEMVLGNLEHTHQSFGFRECAYQMLLDWKGRKPRKCTFGDLYSALLREKMNSVAKFMAVKILNPDHKDDSE